MDKLLSLMDKLSSWIGKSASIFSLLTAAVITYEIFVRQVLVSPTVWAAEATVFACGILYLLGGPWTLLEDKHVRVDALYRRFSPRLRALVDSITFLPFCLYLLVMIWATWHYAVESLELGETTMSPWNPPIWPMKLIMLVALVLIFLQGTAKFLRDLAFLAKGRRP
ncbi:MAG: TRAP transporter small permease subunit [bacterium]